MDVFTALKQKLAILDVIGDSIALKKAGSYWKGPCPFHAEKTASFTVTPGKEIFYCFGCHASGDVIGFIARKENISQVEAADYLIEKYGLDIQRSPQNQPQQGSSYYAAWKFFATWCQTNLFAQHPAYRYIKERGLSDELIQRAMIGVSPTSSAGLNNLLKAAKNQNLVAADLLQAHILIETKHGLYLPFEDRLIFPINDVQGRTVGCGGRIYKNGDTRAKYYNSHEHQLFSKGTILYGLDQAKRAMHQEQKAILVEGYMDCLALWQTGFPYAVATLGTACTKEQLHTISRYAPCIYLMYDADDAGQKAMLRCVELCWHNSIDARIILLPTGEDPASLIAKNGAIQPLFARAKDLFAFYLQQLGHDFFAKPLHDRLQLIKAIIETIKKIENNITRHMLLQRAAQVFDMPLSVLTHENIRTRPIKTMATKTKKSAFIDKDIGALLLLIAHHELLNNEERSLCYQTISLASSLVTAHQQFFSKNPQGDFSSFFNSLQTADQQILNKFLTTIADDKVVAEKDQLLQHLRKKRWKEALSDVKLRLAHAQRMGESEAIKKILTEYTLLQQELLHKEAV